MPTTTIHWNRNADGDWATKADWTPHRLPGATDNVSINTADLHTITHSVGTDTINTLTVGNDDFVVSGGSLTIQSTSSFANGVTLSGGTLALGGDATVANLTQDGGTISGSGTLTVTGAAAFTPNAGHNSYPLQTGSGTTLLEGITNFTGGSPAAALFLDGGRILENQGTLDFAGQEIDLGLNRFGKALGGGTIKNDAGGTVILNGGFVRPGAGAIAFINAGTLESGTGAGIVGAPLTNTGKVLVQSGALYASAVFTNSGPGTVSIASGGMLFLFDGSASASAFTVAAGGKLDFFPGNHTPGLFTLGAGTIHGTGQVAVDGGELALGAGAVTVTNFTQGINSTVSGPGTLTITGVGSGIVCLQTGPGTTLFTASSRFGFGPFNLDGGRVLENQGSGDLGNITLGANPFGRSLGGGTIKNDAGGTLSISGYVKCVDGGTIKNDAGGHLTTAGDLRVVNGAGANSFINAGTFEKFFLPNPATGQDITVGVIGVNFTDSGAIRIDGGTLEFTGASNSFAGSISTVGNGVPAPTLAFAGGTSALNSGTTITVPQWSLSNGAVVNLNETLDFTGLFSEKDAGTTLNVAAGYTLSLTGGGTELAGAVGGAGTVSVLSGTIANLTVRGSATLIDTSGVDQNGTLTLGDAGGGAATLSIGAGATYSIDNNWGIARGASLASSIQNGGLLIKAGGTGTSVIGVAIADAGSIAAGGGTLDLTQAITGAGTLAVYAGATLELDFSAAATLGMSFKGAHTTLALLDPSQFAATIAGFAPTDTIHLLARTATSATLEAGDKLVIADGSSTVATLQLTGNFTGDAFHVASDGTAGTLVTVTMPGATPAAGHALIAAMAGLGASGGGPLVAMSSAHADAWRPALLAPGRSTHFA